MKKIVFIGGPTASGKTNLAVNLAQKFNGELINADSRQVYKYLNIGTNKGDIELKDNQYYIKNIPIHLISFLNPDKRFSVFEFKDAAIKLIDSIIEKGKLPIIVGGTGLYIDSIIKNYQLSGSQDLELRKELETKSLPDLQEILKSKHPENYRNLNSSDKSNPQRIVRLIEKLSAKPKLETMDNHYDYVFLYPEYNWEELIEKISDRVEQMFKEGLVEEVKTVLNLGFKKDSVALTGTGYKEVIDMLDGAISLQECIELVKISHRQYAKRQRTWFEGKGRGYNLIKIESTKQAEGIVNKFYDNDIN